MDNCNRLKAFTKDELFGFAAMGIKANDFLIHRGELCRVAFTKSFELEWYNDQEKETRAEWLEALNI